MVGLYGKLPSYGDFLIRNLDSEFVTAWDEWLQHYIAGSKEQLGVDWLDIYLTSPIWRFVFSSGVVDRQVWAGIMMPSVDRVGRYFPISLVKQLPPSVSPVHLLAAQHDWFDALEQTCLQALDSELDVDQLIDLANQIPWMENEMYEPTAHLGESGGMVLGLHSMEDDETSKVWPYLLNAQLSMGHSSFSLWQTKGSELIGPAILYHRGLPSISGITSMIDGQWQQRNWKIPYNPKQVMN